MSKDIALEIKNVHKSFRLPTEQSSGIKQLIINFFKGVKGYKEQRVLKGISFKVEKGDFFGVVGRNGSGKSTLLKIISGIYSPEKGSIRVNGSLVPFIELGVGFNPDLTGRENVFLNGALLGFSRPEIEEMYDEIVDFAELHEFMDQKLRNYSSGMQVRLAFSIAIRAESDILVLDEVLAVGDEAFKRKCNGYFDKIRKNKDKTVILVTHSMESVREYCNKAIMIKKGKIEVFGSPDKVADSYSLENFENLSKSIETNSGKSYIVAKLISDPVLGNDDKLKVQITYKNISNRPVYPKIIINYRGVPVMCANGKLLYDLITSDTKVHRVNYELSLKSFNRGECSIAAVLVDSEDEVNIAEFGYGGGLVFKINNKTIGNKIGGIMSDVGSMEIK